MSRSGYGRKPNQTNVLKIKLGHDAVAELLNECTCKHGGGGGVGRWLDLLWQSFVVNLVIVGRVQWDPAREIEMSDLDRKCPMPRRSYKRKDIQIGVKGKLNEMYVASVISIQDVTDLAHKLQEAHSQRSEKEVSFC